MKKVTKNQIKKSPFMKAPVLFLFCMLFTGFALAQSLKINITGLRNNSGTVRMGFYSSNESFEKETPLFVKNEPKASIVNGVLSITYTDLKPGLYGVALFDDENNNDKVDYGWFLPKEGFGFTNYYHTGITRPHFSKFSFLLGAGSKVVEIKVRYL
jgi:uncharacterized protein (DUF2141 family)